MALALCFERPSFGNLHLIRIGLYWSHGTRFGTDYSKSMGAARRYYVCRFFAWCNGTLRE